MSRHQTPPANESTRADLANAILNAGYNAAYSRRTAIKAAFALAGAAVLFGNPAIARAASASKETLDALDKAQAELDSVQAQLDAIADDFQALSVEQDKTISKIEGVQDKIDATQAKIDEKQQELETKQDGLAERVSNSYKQGRNSGLALLLSSATFDELVSNAHYIDKINASDKEAIDEVHRIQEELAAQKSKLEGQKADLEALKDKQAAQLKQMKAKQAEIQTILSGLSADVKSLMEKRDAEYLASAQEEERQRKAAEEAARRAQQTTDGAVSVSGGGAANVTGGSGQSSANATGGQQRVVSACHSVGSPGVGLCAMWVSQVFAAAGFPYYGGNANDMYNAYCTSSNKSKLKVGMVVAVSTHGHTSAGRTYGHIGIYVGNNTIMDNVGSIRSISVDSWVSYYGDIVTPRWGWLGGVALG